MFIRWTELALSDLKTISQRIEHERNLATANRVCRTIYDAVQMMRDHPYSGRLGLEEGTRELVILKTPTSWSTA
jgi:plasmid stabilization system protein ParE